MLHACIFWSCLCLVQLAGACRTRALPWLERGLSESEATKQGTEPDLLCTGRPLCCARTISPRYDSVAVTALSTGYRKLQVQNTGKPLNYPWWVSLDAERNQKKEKCRPAQRRSHGFGLLQYLEATAPSSLPTRSSDRKRHRPCHSQTFRLVSLDAGRPNARTLLLERKQCRPSAHLRGAVHDSTLREGAHSLRILRATLPSFGPLPANE